MFYSFLSSLHVHDRRAGDIVVVLTDRQTDEIVSLSSSNGIVMSFTAEGCSSMHARARVQMHEPTIFRLRASAIITASQMER